MIFKRIKSEGLAHNSYFIGSGDEAAVIDPRRDCDVYVDLAKQKEVRIRYIFETHRNEDYVIGSLELSGLTGADIFHGPGPDWGYGSTLRDGEEFLIGTLRIRALQTPGHTDESMSYVLADLQAGEEPVMVFTGDALFIGDVGRTDLYGPGEEPGLAGELYDSIFNRILPLGDGVILCPAHGAGSICGGSIGDRDYSTTGIERSQNPVLQLTDRDDFIKYKVSEHHELPPYFKKVEQYNTTGPSLLGRLPAPPYLTPVEFNDEMKHGAVVVDTRCPPAFGGAHIRASYNIWLDGLPSYAGWVLSFEEPILLVLGHSDHLDRAVRYLVRLGYDNIAGYLKGGIEGWYNSGFDIEYMGMATVHEIKRRLDSGEDLHVLDVRSDGEWEEGHIKDALHIPVGQLRDRLGEVPQDSPVATVCDSGNRASMAASILLRAGHPNVCCDVLGSMKAWKASNYTIVRESGIKNKNKQS